MAGSGTHEHMPTNGFDLLEQWGFEGTVKLLLHKNSKSGRAIAEIIRRNSEANRAFEQNEHVDWMHYLEEHAEDSLAEIIKWAGEHGVEPEKAVQIAWDKRAIGHIERIIIRSGDHVWAVAGRELRAFLQTEARLAKSRHHKEAWGPPEKPWKRREHGTVVGTPAIIRRRKPIVPI